MLRSRLLLSTFALAGACVSHRDIAPGEHDQTREPAITSDGASRHAQGPDDRAESAGAASAGEASADDASSADAAEGDASRPGDSSPGDAGADAGEPSAAGDDAGEPSDAGDESGADASPADAAPSRDGLCTRCGDCEEVQTIAGAAHIEGDLVYPDVPPTGGDHNPCWTTYGVHEEQVPDERWVHNLEHGAVVFLYNCPNGCPNELAQLRALVAACGVFAVLTPYDLLPKRFAAVSWGHRLVSDCLDVEALRAFYDKNVDNGGESNPANPPGYCLH